MGSIPRRSNLSVEEFTREYLDPQKPVILTDATARWSALQKWTPAYFKERHGDHVVRVDGKDRTVGDYIDELLASSAEKPAPYMSSVDIGTDFPQLLTDLSPDQDYRQPYRLGSRLLPKDFPKAKQAMELFIGGPGSNFPYLHYDVFHLQAFLSQIYGEKDVVMYPPEQTPFLYPSPDAPEASLIGNVYAADMEKFPLLRNATPLHDTLRAGETLYIPCGWWHSTRMRGLSITVGQDSLNASNWAQFIGDQFSRKRAAGKRLLGAAMLGYLIVAGAVMTAWERLRGVTHSPVDWHFIRQFRAAVSYKR